MTTRSWICKLFARTVRKAPARCRPAVEALEDRLAPALLTVNTLADTVDTNPAVTSLREAITQANSQASDDTIQFSVSGTINLTGALPDLSSNLVIQGPGAGSLTVRRDTGGAYRIFGVASGATVGLSGLTIANGSDVDGGGIANQGTLTVSNSILSGNSAGGGGGGILNVRGSTLTVSNSTLSGNSAGLATAFDGWGGGIFNLGAVTVSNSTLSGNSAASGGGIANGGAVTSTGATLTVSNSTFSGNFATDGGDGGGIYNTDSDGSLTLNNTIVANSPSGGDVVNNSTLTGSHNLIESGFGLGGLTGTLTADPNLGLLANNGGPTLTHALLPGSPAINAGNNAAAAGLTTDQRGLGFPRISGGTVDIGAFEVQQNTAPTIARDQAAVTVNEGSQATNTGTFSDAEGNSTVTLTASLSTSAKDF